MHLKASLPFIVLFLVASSISQELLEPGIDSYSLKTELSANKVDSPRSENLYSPDESASVFPTTEKTSVEKRYHVAKFDFDHVAAPFIITAWIFAACCAKIVFHVSPKLANYCPESCMLLLVGVVLGLVLFYSGMVVGPLTPTVFFLFMLPPIVFDAGYFMPNRLFFDNIISILVYAIIGTVWNALAIGTTLYFIGLTGIFGDHDIPIMHMLLFSSIVSAVDPVAVLAVFEEIHVNEVLYIIVFGESLLNDAVTVVLYHMFEGYTEMEPNILPIDYFSGVASFFVVSLGGTFIGITFGFLTAFLSKYTTPVAVIEPMFPFIMGYLSYLFAEMFHLSGIMALVFCGLTMKNYVEENISPKSHVTVKYVTKMLATASETIIFVVLGVSTVNDKHEWNTWFVLFSIIFCSVYRAIGVVVLSACLNRFRLHQLNGVEQFIMSYGGLRGAVAFALALIIDEKVIPSKHMMVTTIIAVVYFTVFVQGMTIKFFVRILKVPQKSEKELTMNERLHGTVIDHLMGGIEEVVDQILGNYKIRDRFRYFNNKYLRPILTNNHEVTERKIFETHSKLNLEDAMNMVNNGNGSRTNLDTGIPLSTVIKNYTQSNLNTIGPDEVVSSDNALRNIDMAEITYNPSFKDLNDSQIHHILEDSMFKPPKRTRRYSHSQFYENEPKHPPFHHHMRMQIRRLVSENKRKRKRNRVTAARNGAIPNDNMLAPTSTVYRSSDPSHPHVTVTAARDEESDDGGIVFSAMRPPTPEENDQEQASKSVTSQDSPPPEVNRRTLTETVLPWKRNDSRETDPAKPQEEFPTWVNNREHYPGYFSPTPTFLESLNDLADSGGIIHQSIEELDDDIFLPDDQYPGTTSDECPSGPEPGGSKTLEQHGLGQVQEDIIKEVMQQAQHSIPKPPQDVRQRFFRRSRVTDTPGSFSFASVEDSSRPTTSDSISIECPDVVLDLEHEPEKRETKM
ncbi:hypothetical protein JTE90_016063 [Oedothorax gibbosus]|uniref:Sodium/hydrogen exchanger n=1 Tax=Oedothorax gibbosus TaxID=931172 RepID=A0AAV6TYU0_9ARAC|nr:hypothetical protein JTE90_016063 [Oedothorax gibbosus]